MHKFLEFALTRFPDENITSAEVAQWAGRLNNWAFYNAIAVEVALKYYKRELEYPFCDYVVNILWRAVIDGFSAENPVVTHSVPRPFYDVYEAFDAGEYYRTPEKTDNPVTDNTDPLIAEFVARLGL